MKQVHHCSRTSEPHLYRTRICEPVHKLNRSGLRRIRHQATAVGCLWRTTKDNDHSRFRADSISVRTSGSACERSPIGAAPSHAAQAKDASGSGVTSTTGNLICICRVLRQQIYQWTTAPSTAGPAATTRTDAVAVSSKHCLNHPLPYGV